MHSSILRQIWLHSKARCLFFRRIFTAITFPFSTFLAWASEENEPGLLYLEWLFNHMMRDLYHTPPAVTQGGIFIVPHLLWHREGSLLCHTCCDTGRDLYCTTPAAHDTGRDLYCTTPAVTHGGIFVVPHLLHMTQGGIFIVPHLLHTTQGGIFIVPHLLWHREGSLLYHTCCTWHREGTSLCHIYCDTGRDLYYTTPAVIQGEIFIVTQGSQCLRCDLMDLLTYSPSTTAKQCWGGVITRIPICL
jgi:drug/metabolite transporter superfamily protein YnfA